MSFPEGLSPPSLCALQGVVSTAGKIVGKFSQKCVSRFLLHRWEWEAVGGKA